MACRFILLQSCGVPDIWSGGEEVEVILCYYIMKIIWIGRIGEVSYTCLLQECSYLSKLVLFWCRSRSLQLCIYEWMGTLSAPEIRALALFFSRLFFWRDRRIVAIWVRIPKLFDSSPDMIGIVPLIWEMVRLLFLSGLKFTSPMVLKWSWRKTLGSRS